METEEIVACLKEQYVDVKVLPDGSIAALCDLMYTRSVALGCDEFSFKRRFCFENRQLANSSLKGSSPAKMCQAAAMSPAAPRLRIEPILTSMSSTNDLGISNLKGDTPRSGV